MLVATLLREWFTSEQFGRIPEPDLVMNSEEAVSAFVRAGGPNGILSGIYAFYVKQACKMIQPGNRVLDLGCGPASLLGSIALLNRNCAFIGVDASARMIAAGQELLHRLAADNVVLRMEDMTQLHSIEPESIDVVLSSMAMHHLSDSNHLRHCFEAIERVMAPNGHVFIFDFGRLNSMKSVEYFVSRAIPSDEPKLQNDYRASLRAAFSVDEFGAALSSRMKDRVAIYSTALSPLIVVMMTSFPDRPPDGRQNANRVLKTLPRARLADYRLVTLFLRLGGMPIH